MSKLLLLTLGWVSAASVVWATEWTRLASLPNSGGLAGSFAGVSNGVLLVAGGTNSPDKPPEDGGAKAWYGDVFVLEHPADQWRIAGKLPHPLGYGVSVSYKDRIVCVGGSDQNRCYADVFQLEWIDGKLSTTALPALRRPVANACGAMVGSKLFIAGGIDKPESTRATDLVWCIDLSQSQPRWMSVETWGARGAGRMLSVAAGNEKSFWMFGGAELIVGEDGKLSRRYCSDAYRYDLVEGWRRVADMPCSMAAAPSPAPIFNDAIYILGGDAGTQVNVLPAKHKGFSAEILGFHLTTLKQWDGAGKVDAPRVTTPCVRWNNAWIIPSGEERPGVRSPEVWSWAPAE